MDKIQAIFLSNVNYFNWDGPEPFSLNGAVLTKAHTFEEVRTQIGNDYVLGVLGAHFYRSLLEDKYFFIKNCS